MLIFSNREFSSENLLFATEYSQFRAVLGLDPQTLTDIECMPFQTVLSNEYSLSTTNVASNSRKPMNKEKNDDETVLFLEMVKKLYNKYIKEGSPYEINISYENRHSLAELIDDEIKTEMTALPPSLSLSHLHQTVIPILEKILVEIVMLLHQSFGRFKRSDKWVEVVNVLTENRKRSKSVSDVNETVIEIGNADSNVIISSTTTSAIDM